MDKIKSYARTIGKRLSASCQELLATNLPRYQFSKESLSGLRDLYVEIGFGYGEHIHRLASQNPSAQVLGVEVYKNGVCNLLKLCSSKPLDNLSVHLGDADDVLHQLEDDSVSKFYILFPDPWPKARHNKRRFLNAQRLRLILNKLSAGGEMIFATDIESYLDQVTALLENVGGFSYEVTKLDPANLKYESRYHSKAVNDNRMAVEVIATKLTPKLNQVMQK